MIKNHIKIAFRSFRRNQGFSLINILGLAIGITCSLLIFLFVQNELSYDRFHKDGDDVYRIAKDFVNDDGSRIPDATTPAALAPAMNRELPEVKSITRIRPNWGRSYFVKYKDKRISEEKIYGVDSSFFDVFTFPFIVGNARDAFRDINSIVLTETAAKRYFGKENAIGKTLNVDAFGDVLVTGVIKDVPPNAHFHFDLLVSFRRQPGNVDIDNNWTGYNDYTYVKTKPRVNRTTFTRKIQALYDKSVEEKISEFFIQPVSEIHLQSNLKWELEQNGSKQYVNIFMLIGIFIVIIAAINYINLATAKASARAKEVGVRKVIGAVKTTLINQFLVESILTCLMASLLAVIFAWLLLPTVNKLTGTILDFSGNPMLIFYILIGTLLLGLLAGFFPAIYLSSFKPAAVLKGFKLNERGALYLRRVLVVVQFSISIILIIGALVISQQMNHLMSANLGFDKEQIVTVTNAGALPASTRNALRNEIGRIPGVKQVSASNGMLPNQFNTGRVSVKGSSTEQQLNFIYVGYNFLDVMDIKMKEGRKFSTDFLADSVTNGIPGGPLEQTFGSIILNEAAVKELSIPSPVIGKQILWSRDADTSYYLNIVGVTKDFHFTSLRNTIKPFGFLVNPKANGTIIVKLSGNNISGTLAAIQQRWKTFSPERPMQYSFLDDTFSKLYQSETRFQKVFISLVVLGIVIACLGLLGLATFAAQQRVKEIGIRKVLGASVAGVVGLLSKDFLKLVLISFVIALPVGWYAVTQWLQNFAYRVEVRWWIYLVAAVLAILVAFLTISFQTIKAALANPVKNLRTE
ncbi:ABC transporter permease [Flavitalea antarctica]